MTLCSITEQMISSDNSTLPTIGGFKESYEILAELPIIEILSAATPHVTIILLKILLKKLTLL